MIFNIMVEAAVIAKLEVVCSPQEARHGMGWAVLERNLIFYADEGRIGGRDHIWAKDALPVNVAIFRLVGLDTNLEKTKDLVCTPGDI